MSEEILYVNIENICNSNYKLLKRKLKNVSKKSNANSLEKQILNFNFYLNLKLSRIFNDVRNYISIISDEINSIKNLEYLNRYSFFDNTDIFFKQNIYYVFKSALYEGDNNNIWSPKTCLNDIELEEIKKSLLENNNEHLDFMNSHIKNSGCIIGKSVNREKIFNILNNFSKYSPDRKDEFEDNINNMDTSKYLLISFFSYLIQNINYLILKLEIKENSEEDSEEDSEEKKKITNILNDLKKKFKLFYSYIDKIRIDIVKLNFYINKELKLFINSVNKEEVIIRNHISIELILFCGFIADEINIHLKKHIHLPKSSF